ncbi:peptide chain release factor N(5)-glutamine methyltransferase [Devosia rhizoryzae]|uniref:Release factor glutamine methyltransferase n=1 Tax=Devosia rhizoryzae TaxID=2774137 RepID=A0ABX7C5C2_9HYPH|nr:peptide chain release factor N(5)-glutamine methyltransferase [Devosia rhizoryzae]
MLDRDGFATATLDAKLLTGHALGLDALALSLRENEPVSDAIASRVDQLLRRRMTGESVARIIGEREFYGLAFGLNAATLEPRTDTELLVDLALKALPRGGHLLDLGTGTGCIPISILVNRPDTSAMATDVSAEALEMAERNAGRHGVAGRIDFARGSWFEALTSPFGGEVDAVSRRVRGPSAKDEEGPLTRPSADLSPRGRGEEGFDLIVSNPPYIASAVIDTLSPEVKSFDPMLALDGGRDGIEPYRVIASASGHYLRHGGQVMVEIGYDQGRSVALLFEGAGFSDVAVHRDLAGLDRVVVAHHL